MNKTAINKTETIDTIVTALHAEVDAINAAVDYLTALGVTTGAGDVVNGELKAFLTFREDIAKSFHAKSECTKEHAADVARDFLKRCGYRQKAAPKNVAKKKPSKWNKAKAVSVKTEKDGDRIMVGGVIYAPVK